MKKIYIGIRVFSFGFRQEIHVKLEFFLINFF